MTGDDRILCVDCREFATWSGACMAAKQGRRHDVGERYGPADVDLPRRCEFFIAREGADDPRLGRERYPTLWAEYEATQGGRQRVHQGHAQRGIERAKAALATT